MLGEPKVGFLLSLYWARHELGQPHDKDKKPIMGGCREKTAWSINGYGNPQAVFLTGVARPRG